MKTHSHQHPSAAFTMIEIAIAISVIAFALVAIMGVMPAGMQVQRDNRQDTIINGDGTYLLEAIRGGAENIPDLVSFAEWSDGPVTAAKTSYDVITNMCAPGLHTNIFRAITGPATQRGEGVPTFRYMVLSEVRQLGNINPELPHADEMRFNTFEVRLAFFWPLKPASPNRTVLTVPNELPEAVQRHVLRTIVTGLYDTNGMFNLAEFRPRP